MTPISLADIQCPICDGAGHAPSSRPHCWYCGGTGTREPDGEVVVMTRAAFERLIRMADRDKDNT